MDITQRIAVLCDYELLPSRVGGMDYFFWQFDVLCKEQSIFVDWFFPNTCSHGGYATMSILATDSDSLESYFLTYLKQNTVNYSHIITHFLELCTPFHKKVKSLSGAIIIGVDHNPRPTNGYSFKKRMLKRLKGLLYSKHISTFVGVSEYSKQQLIQEFGSQITSKSIVVFNGLEVAKYKQKTDFSSCTQFVIACHLRKDKGVQDVIEVVRQLKAELSIPFNITIYGSGYYEQHLKDAVADFDLQSYFEFKGSVSNLHDLYCSYDYLLHTSHGETFCYTVVESLLSNLPVITNNQGNVLGLVQDHVNGFLYQDHDLQQLKMILSQVISGVSTIENGLQHTSLVATFSLEKMVQNHFQLVHLPS